MNTLMLAITTLISEVDTLEGVLVPTTNTTTNNNNNNTC
jgi:hypothetical protein